MAINVKRILVPVDFSAVSELSIEYAASMAEKFGAELLVINIVESSNTWGVELNDPVNVKDKWNKEAITEAEETIVKLCKEVSSSLKVVHKVLAGDVGATIVACVKKEHCDMLVMGAHGSSGVLSDWLGGVAYKVSKRATCPVLMVRKS